LQNVSSNAYGRTRNRILRNSNEKSYIDPRIDGLENVEDLQQANISDEEEENQETSDAECEKK